MTKFQNSNECVEILIKGVEHTRDSESSEEESGQWLKRGSFDSVVLGKLEFLEKNIVKLSEKANEKVDIRSKYGAKMIEKINARLNRPYYEPA